ncbi:winged helix-turn-helix domain-containing protein [Actinomycetospora sp. TBRC 11914]|uniref:winged helix-turn-helix domain-containing protein n=1 Tax=Actinomycetospora sp. TBRC 11914 TaxID=2729387 RepID=UPI00145FC791|nr:winged helix-turn-helix domain-containing protein [Actinomycetospora sp. TBRC 11914]NMO93565.1 winged helix-turn-helix transcriptional regulator [Actinomycetospora sp. TBRC 11914]
MKPAEAAAVALRSRIEAGEFRPGERLPPARVVAEEHGVSMSTLTRAIGFLQAQGVVTVVYRRGTYVGAPE